MYHGARGDLSFLICFGICATKAHVLSWKYWGPITSEPSFSYYCQGGGMESFNGYRGYPHSFVKSKVLQGLSCTRSEG